MGSCTSKMDFSDFILDGFDPKITFPPSIRVRNIIFDRFLKIFGNYEHFKKNIEKNVFFQNHPKIVLNRSKKQNCPIFRYRYRYISVDPAVRYVLYVSSRPAYISPGPLPRTVSRLGPTLGIPMGA